MSSNHNFQVDLRGVIDLLSDHLYSGPHVYLRELMQNSVDAITARKQIDHQLDPTIRIEIIDGNAAPTLVVYDNGIGLTPDEVHQFLATIGQSSKRQVDRSDFIGQFGIGLLSGFMVCEEVVVITRSARGDSPTVEWKGRSDGTYSIRNLEHDAEPGTQVFLRAKPGCHEFFKPKFVRETARHYGTHLPISVTIVHGQDRKLINEVPPWRYEYSSGESRIERQLEYGQRVFDQQFLDAIPLESEIGGIEGIAYVLPFASTNSSRRNHRVYLKDMLVSENADNLLPEWAFFIRCVVNANSLRPTAAREGFFEDETLDMARGELGGCIRRYLVQLAKDDRRRLDRIIDLHHIPIKGLAVEDDEFFQMFINWLPFETSMGTMTLEEYYKLSDVVRFVPTRDQFRQVSSVASAQNICLINGGYIYDTELLNKLPNVFSGTRVEEVDVSELAQDFEDLTLDQREECFSLVQLGNVVLQKFKCSAEIRKFHPETLPTLYTVNEAANFLRSIDQSREQADELWGGVLDSIAESASAGANAQLCLNYNNPLIRRLATLDDRELVKQSLEMLYVQALLLGHYPLRGGEMQLLGSGLLNMIDSVVASKQKDKDV